MSKWLINNYDNNLFTFIPLGELRDYLDTTMANIFKYYNQLGLHWVYDESVEINYWGMLVRAHGWQDYLLSIYDEGQRRTPVPIADTTTITTEHSGDSGTMSENSPIDANYTITTPIGKSTGKFTETETKTINNNTVNEARIRAEVVTKYAGKLTNICFSIIDPFVDELTIGY